MIPQQRNRLDNAFDDDASFHRDEAEKEQEEDVDDDSQEQVPQNIDDSNIDKESSQSSCLSTSTSSTAPHTATAETKDRKRTVGYQDKVKSILLEMEHKPKMKNLKLKESILILKKQKLENEMMRRGSNNIPIASESNDVKNNFAGVWQPFV